MSRSRRSREQDSIRWPRLERASLIAALGGTATFIFLSLTPIAGAHPVTQAAISYVVAFQAWLAIPLGCLVLLMTHYLTGGAWGVLLRPILEAGSRTMILMAFLAIPLVVVFFLGDQSPYPWARPLESVATGDVLAELREKARLLNPEFVTIRLAAFFVIWLMLDSTMRRWSRQWRSGDAASGERLPSLSGPGLVVYAVTITLAAMDWIMSLEPFWKSTMVPAIYAIGQITAAFAFATAVLIALANVPPLAGRVTSKHLRDLGGLLMAFVMLWAYVSFSQFLLIWVGNLPDESFYYFKRLRGGWAWIGVGLIAVHFAIPFVVLLFRGAKESPRVLLRVAILVLAMRFVDTVWWIEPAFPHAAIPWFALLDMAAIVAVGGLWSWWFLGVLKRTTLVPVHGANECEEGGSHG